MAEIRAVKIEVAKIIYRQLDLKPHETVIEIGSGIGIMAAWLAPKVKQLYCCDVSKSFLKIAENECRELSNVSFHLTKSFKLDFVEDASIDSIFANCVFIHLNIYEIFLYFKEFNRVLKKGGKVWFDIANSDELVSRLPDLFREMIGYYEKNAVEEKLMIHYNSPIAVSGVAKNFGFKQISVEPANFLLFQRDDGCKNHKSSFIPRPFLFLNKK